MGARFDEEYQHYYALPQCAFRESQKSLKQFIHDNRLEELLQIPCPNFIFSEVVSFIAKLRTMEDIGAWDSDPDEQEWWSSLVDYGDAASSIKSVEPRSWFASAPQYKVTYESCSGLKTATVQVKRDVKTGALWLSQLKESE